MELPDDVVQWVSSHFKEIDIGPALAQLRTAVIHTGEPASSRLLRCVVVSSGGDRKILDLQIQQLKVDWRDVIVAGEYQATGQNFEGNNLVRVHDFNLPIQES